MMISLYSLPDRNLVHNESDETVPLARSLVEGSVAGVLDRLDFELKTRHGGNFVEQIDAESVIAAGVVPRNAAIYHEVRPLLCIPVLIGLRIDVLKT